MRTVSDRLAEVQNDGLDPIYAFDIPSWLVGQEREIHAQEYEAVVRRIATDVGTDRTAIPAAALDHLLKPWAWRPVARFCRSFDRVPLTPGADPGLWALAAGLGLDVTEALDASVRAAKRHDPVAPCHPAARVIPDTEGGPLVCEDCGRQILTIGRAPVPVA